MSLYLQLQGEGVEALRMFLATHLIAKQLNRLEVKEVVPNELTNVLKTRELRQVARWLDELRAFDPSTPSLASLLWQGKGVQVRAMAAQEGEKEETMKEEKVQYLAKRREKLQRLDEEMQYGSMVRNCKTPSAAKEVARYQKNVRQHLSIGANMVMARVTAFIAVYFAARNLTDNETTRLVAGLGGAIGMMVIEMVLFIARAAKIESFEHQQRERKSIF